MDHKYLADEFALKLINDRNVRNAAYRIFCSNYDQFPELEGVISSSVLKQILRRARFNRKLQNMLCELLYYVDAGSISDDNFRRLLHFPSRKRNTYLSAISHSELAFYQMLELNRHPLSLEAFEYLFNRICLNDIFTTGDLIKILCENRDTRVCVLSDCIALAREYSGAEEKIQIAEYLLNNAPSDSHISEAARRLFLNT